MIDPPSADIVVVSWNSMRWLPAAIESALAQSCRPASVVVVDNASTDGAPKYLDGLGSPVRCIRNSENRGFAAAMNQGIEATGSEWVLALNPDVVLDSRYLERLFEVASAHPRAGELGGILHRPDGEVDSAGLSLKRIVLRPLDRPRPRGSKGEPEPCFGICAAAALYRRAMLEDVRFRGHYFDPLFFAFYEDVDLSWRSRHRGWEAYFVPTATATHVRGASGAERSREGRLRSLRNRYLAIYKNLPVRCLIQEGALILLVEAARLVRNGSLQLEGLREGWRSFPECRAWRAHIQSQARPGRVWYLRR